MIEKNEKFALILEPNGNLIIKTVLHHQSEISGFGLTVWSSNSSQPEAVLRREKFSLLPVDGTVCWQIASQTRAIWRSSEDCNQGYKSSQLKVNKKGELQTKVTQNMAPYGERTLNFPVSNNGSGYSYPVDVLGYTHSKEKFTIQYLRGKISLFFAFYKFVDFGALTLSRESSELAALTPFTGARQQLFKGCLDPYAPTDVCYINGGFDMVVQDDLSRKVKGRITFAQGNQYEYYEIEWGTRACALHLSSKQLGDCARKNLEWSCGSEHIAFATLRPETREVELELKGSGKWFPKGFFLSTAAAALIHHRDFGRCVFQGIGRKQGFAPKDLLDWRCYNIGDKYSAYRMGRLGHVEYLAGPATRIDMNTAYECIDLITHREKRARSLYVGSCLGFADNLAKTTNSYEGGWCGKAEAWILHNEQGAISSYRIEVIGRTGVPKGVFITYDNSSDTFSFSKKKESYQQRWTFVGDAFMTSDDECLQVSIRSVCDWFHGCQHLEIAKCDGSKEQEWVYRNNNIQPKHSPKLYLSVALGRQKNNFYLRSKCGRNCEVYQQWALDEFSDHFSSPKSSARELVTHPNGIPSKLLHKVVELIEEQAEKMSDYHSLASEASKSWRISPTTGKLYDDVAPFDLDILDASRVDFVKHDQEEPKYVGLNLNHRLLKPTFDFLNEKNGNTLKNRGEAVSSYHSFKECIDYFSTSLSLPRQRLLSWKCPAFRFKISV